MRGALAAAALVVLAALCGCGAENRYRVLSTFFDGVPPPAGAFPGTDAGSAARAGAPPPAAVYFKHAPYAKRQCGGCHEPGSNALIAPVPALCFTCHKMDLQARKRVHGPVATGFCVLCHSPHGSPNPSLLVLKPVELCFYCHNQEEVFQTQAHQSREQPCEACHLTHADSKYFLRPEPAAAPGAGM